MPSSPTLAQRHKVTRDPISDAHVILLEFQEDGDTTVQRVAINNENITSNANTYTAYPVTITLPGSGDSDQSVGIEATNVDRVLGAAFAKVRTRLGCRIMLIDASAPNTLIYDTGSSLILADVTITAETVSGRLLPRAPLDEPYPWRRTTKQFFPGLFFTR